MPLGEDRGQLISACFTEGYGMIFVGGLSLVTRHSSLVPLWSPYLLVKHGNLRPAFPRPDNDNNNALFSHGFPSEIPSVPPSRYLGNGARRSTSLLPACYLEVVQVLLRPSCLFEEYLGTCDEPPPWSETLHSRRPFKFGREHCYLVVLHQPTYTPSPVAHS